MIWNIAPLSFAKKARAILRISEKLFEHLIFVPIIRDVSDFDIRISDFLNSCLIGLPTRG